MTITRLHGLSRPHARGLALSTRAPGRQPYKRICVAVRGEVDAANAKDFAARCAKPSIFGMPGRAVSRLVALCDPEGVIPRADTAQEASEASPA